jgi:hypothetical protein
METEKGCARRLSCSKALIKNSRKYVSKVMALTVNKQRVEYVREKRDERDGQQERAVSAAGRGDEKSPAQRQGFETCYGE